MERQNINDLSPAHLIHPGLVLKKELVERGLRQREFAGDIGIAPTQLNEIIKGKRGISVETALLMETSLGVKAITWLNLQSNYDINLVKKDKDFQKRTEIVKEWKVIKGLIPYSFLKKEKLIIDNKEKDIKTVLNIYNVKTTKELEDIFNNPEVSRFRKSPVRKVNRVNLTGWVKFVEYQARNKKVKPFRVDKREELINELREIFLKTNILSEVEKVMAKYGIIFIVQKKLDKVPVDGIASWSGNNPVIAVSLRYKRLDNLAFTIFHEVAHVFLHLINDDEKKPFIDDIEASGNPEEQEEVEANQFAADHLIPKEEWERFMSQTFNFSNDTIKRFSSKIGIHPAIALGRLKREHNEYYRRRFSISNEII